VQRLLSCANKQSAYPACLRSPQFEPTPHSQQSIFARRSRAVATVQHLQSMAEREDLELQRGA